MALTHKFCNIKNIVLGDSGYPLEPWLLTPIENAANNTPEGRYTLAHARARNCIERCFGSLKQRFRCLLKHRVLHYDPVKAANIIYSCAVLHNFAVGIAAPEPDDVLDLNQLDDNLEINNGKLYFFVFHIACLSKL